MYRIELVWNREFNWCNYGNLVADLETAIKLARDIYDSGDGKRVKKIRIMNNETDKLVWDGYRTYEENINKDKTNLQSADTTPKLP